MSFFFITLIFSTFLVFHGSFAQTVLNITAENPMIIAVPNTPFSSKFVQIDLADENHEKRLTGFSLEVFEEVLKLLNYKIYFKFVEFNGSYDDLIASVANKTYDAAVGDITIIAERWPLVEFTVPYTESGLAMVVPVERAEAWIFFKPFSRGLWLATLGILVYKMFVFWFVEHRSNPDFDGSWHRQLGNALWFTLTSLFSVQRETVKSNHTRVVVVVWLFLVMIITQSYTASLSSFLTVKRLHPNVDLLRTKDAKVACNPFIKKFVQNELGYKSENIKLVRLEGEFLDAFQKGTIAAALLEIPYAKLLVSKHCKDYAITGSSYRFGGLSFAFQKGSPIASDVSEAILKLSENGMLKRLEESWITSSECSVDSQTDQDTGSLTFESFWGLYLFSAIVTTVSLLIFIARLLINYNQHQIETNNITQDGDGKLSQKIGQILLYLKNAQLESGGTMTGSRRVAPDQMTSKPETELVLHDPN